MRLLKQRTTKLIFNVIISLFFNLFMITVLFSAARLHDKDSNSKWTNNLLTSYAFYMLEEEAYLKPIANKKAYIPERFRVRGYFPVDQLRSLYLISVGRFYPDKKLLYRQMYLKAVRQIVSKNQKTPITALEMYKRQLVCTIAICELEKAVKTYLPKELYKKWHYYQLLQAYALEGSQEVMKLNCRLSHKLLRKKGTKSSIEAIVFPQDQFIKIHDY